MSPTERPDQPITERYLARLCWNTHDWVRPTGEAARIEHPDTYAARMGFGHEEWLFNDGWILDGWKYGFLQPVNQSLAKVQGRLLEILLYTVGPGSNWLYVGNLRRCEVLTEGLAEQALKEYKRRGWFKEMVRHVQRVGGDLSGLQGVNAPLLLNIRFRFEDAELYHPMMSVVDSDPLRKMRRYKLVAVEGDVVEIEHTWRTRVATDRPRPIGVRFHPGRQPGTVDLIQNRLQNELSNLLASRYGREFIAVEEGYVDIKLRLRGSTTLIEVKSDPRPRYAIREALGQLLEYAFTCEQQGESIEELIVAAPGSLDQKDAEYLTHLRASRHLPVRYVCFRTGMSQVDL